MGFPIWQGQLRKFDSQGKRGGMCGDFWGPGVSGETFGSKL